MAATSGGSHATLESIALLLVIRLGGVILIDAQSFEVPDTAGMKWYRGNTHAHSIRSVGKQSPEGLVTWYRNNGCQFLVITDDGYPSTLDFVRKVSDANFRLLPGMEVMSKTGESWVHVNGINAAVPVLAPDGPSLARTLQATIDAVRAADGIPQIDHPRYMNGPDREAILASTGCSLMEILNGVAGPDQPGEDGRLETESDWDWLLTKGKRIYGVGSDDTCQQPDANGSPAKAGQPGRHWVVIRARNLYAPDICRSLENGLFYTSSGVVLADVSVEPKRISISIEAVDTLDYRMSFIGDGGRVLLTTSANPAIFDLAEKLTYVRAKVTDSMGKSAWVQPVFVRWEIRRGAGRTAAARGWSRAGRRGLLPGGIFATVAPGSAE
jgi:hypothetical protein